MATVNDADELTRRLVDEGARMLVENGPSGLSLRKLAAAAGTSTMAVYTRFGDKQRLLAAMHREGFRRLGARLAGAGGDDTLTALQSFGRAYRAAALDSPYLYDLMFGRAASEFEPDDEGRAAADATYDPLVAAVAHAVEGGVLTGDPERIALHLWVVAHGMVSLELSGMVEMPSDELYDQALAYAAIPFIPAGS